MIIPDFYTKVEQVFHDWKYDHPRILYSLLRSMKPEVAVEIGCYRGYGSCWMARALQENGKGHLYCIDNFSLKQFTPDREAAINHFWSNVDALGLRKWITLIEGDSDKVEWPATCSFAYVDGWHSYKAVAHDFLKAAMLGAECICLDDATQSIGPRMFVNELRQRMPNWDVINILRDCGMAICIEKHRHPMGPITFSQELPDCTGVDLQTLTKAEQFEHLALATSKNGVNYDSVSQSLCEGRKE